jgi:hypothetical protein
MKYEKIKICKTIWQTRWMKSDKDKDRDPLKYKNMTGHLPLPG